MNRPWLNVVAGVIVGVLLPVVRDIDGDNSVPHLDIVSIADDLTVGMGVCVAVTFGVLRWSSRRQPKPLAPDSLSRALARTDRITWRMPPLALLEPVTWSAGTRLGMLALRGYLVVGAILLAVKAVQLGGA